MPQGLMAAVKEPARTLRQTVGMIVLTTSFTTTTLPVSAQDATAPASNATQVLPTVDVVAPSPLVGTGVDRGLVPATSNVLTDKDITRAGPASALSALRDQTPGVNLSSGSGNPYQPNLFFHGFEASPLQGVAQGIAVYLNGVRFNQAFGDTVNWDIIPDIAISRMNLEGANPVFGLNALGGSLNVQMKDGFSYHGGEVTASGGSFGQIRGDLQFGKQIDNAAVYVAATAQHQDGWRQLQSSDVKNLYSDIGWRTDVSEIHLSLIAADTMLNGPGSSPVELLAVDRSAQFTAPNSIANRYLQLNLRGSSDLNDATSLQGLLYYSSFQQHVLNGNAPNDAPCANASGLLCQGSGALSTTTGGVPIPDFLNGGQYGQLDEQRTNTNSYGASMQVSNSTEVFGHKNNLVVGVSFDGAQTQFSGSSTVGGLTNDTRLFFGPGVLVDEPGGNAPVRLSVSNAYYGVFASDIFQVTQQLALTLSGRLNDAQINLHDRNGGDLSGDHSYSHLNPAIGATYKVTPWLSLYTGFSEANRAPTPAELSCASPLNSCSLANFFVGDPALKQVVSQTVEAGLRGNFAPFDGGKLSYNLGFYRSRLNDDIIFVNSAVQGRAYFTNVGQTQRQGFDAGVQLDTARWLAYVNYSFTDATYQKGFVEGAGNNPAADANGNIAVQFGSRLPGIPQHQIKLGAQYKIVDNWSVGATGVFTSATYLFGDEANANPKLPGYFVMNINTSYQITPQVQVFGLVENVTDARYSTFGTFAPTSSVSIAQAPNATNPRSYSPAAPIGAYAGLRVNF